MGAPFFIHTYPASGGLTVRLGGALPEPWVTSWEQTHTHGAWEFSLLLITVNLPSLPRCPLLMNPQMFAAVRLVYWRELVQTRSGRQDEVGDFSF